MIRKKLVTLFILAGIVLAVSCNPVRPSPTSQANIPNPTEVQLTMQDNDSQNTSLTPPPGTATVTVPDQVVINAPLDYCFAYPQGFTLLINGSQVEVMGPYSGVGGVVAGMVWIDVADAPGRTALDIANEEVNAVVGISPLRSTVRLGGEEALVLEGLPGQELIRKIYIVHNGLLYTFNFSPYESANDTANAQTENLFTSVTSSWVWISSGTPCPAKY